MFRLTELSDSGYKPTTYEPSKVVCLVRNYAQHAREMGSAPPEDPVFFLKPRSSLVGNHSYVKVPPGVGRVEHEVELAVVVSSYAAKVRSTDWKRYVLGYAVLVDVTARDLQAKAKSAGMPWAISKGYDTFAPISAYTPSTAVGDPHNLEITLSVNGVRKQSSNTSNMIHKIPEIIEYVTSVMTLEPGDVVATGTPAGVGELKAGDAVEAFIEGLDKLEFNVV